ncbi:MAG: cellulase family glycosylhydrolase [Thermoguttaceae bacterium]
MIFRYMLLAALTLVGLGPLMAAGETNERKLLGLTVVDGVLLRDGKPYRAIGANYFDLFARVLRNPNDTSYRKGLARLAQAGIPFVRFMACGFWPIDNDLYLKDKEAYFRRLDSVVRAAEEEHLGLIPSLFWYLPTVPDIVGEPLDQLGNPRSKTIGFLRRYTTEVIKRYKQSPAIWGWEIGNEYNLGADLPNAAAFRPPVWPNRKTALKRTERDDLKFVHLSVAFWAFAETVRQLDPFRLIISGNSIPRESAYHNVLDGSWKEDSPEQFRKILLRDNASPIDTICVHIYPVKENRYPAGTRKLDELVGLVQQNARRERKPLFIGEFGAGVYGGKEQEQAAFGEILAAIEKHQVPLSAFWVYDFAGQDKEWNITFENQRSHLLQLVIQANQRIRRTLETPATAP